MSTPSTEQLDELRAVLLKLDPTGPDGFEGLISVVLEEVTNFKFRLALSGTQRGLDGASMDDDVIAFEAKLYTGKLSRSDVLIKQADFARSNFHPDLLWILASTTPVSTQLQQDLVRDAETHGMSILILDWQKHQMPELALLLSMAKFGMSSFFKKVLGDDVATLVLKLLEDFAQGERIIEQQENLKSKLNVALTGIEVAKKQNIDFFMKVIHSREESLARLGQMISPHDQKHYLPRVKLTQQLAPYFNSYYPDSIAVLTGDEGCGKSWLPILTWESIERKPMFLFIQADEFSSTMTNTAISNLIIRKIVENTGDTLNTKLQNRWDLRLKKLRALPAPLRPRFVVVLDGLNQRPDHQWIKIISSFAKLIKEVGSNLIISTRTALFQDRIRDNLLAEITQIPVPDWNDSERDELLSKHGLIPSQIPSRPAELLRNPRILSILLSTKSVELLRNPEAITVSSLLFEYIRTLEINTQSDISAGEFSRILRNEARALIKKAEDPRSEVSAFHDGLCCAATGSFFVEADEDLDYFELKPEGLTVALGLALISKLKGALRKAVDLSEYLEVLLEPIQALDDTADVILAALYTLSIDSQVSESRIQEVLLSSFIRLQNLSNSHYPSFKLIAFLNFKSFINVAETNYLSNVYLRNRDWVEVALLEISGEERCWQQATHAIRRWLRYYSLDPKLGASRSVTNPSQEDIDNLAIELEEKCNALSQLEKSMLKNSKLLDHGCDPGALWVLAFKLLAGKSLATFTTEMAHWSLSKSLNSGFGKGHSEFVDLISFNSIDWCDTRRQLLFLSSQLLLGEPSRTGKWAAVTILRATGQSNDAKSAADLANALFKEQGRTLYPSWRLLDDYCAADPCDPSSLQPKNVIATAKDFGVVDVSKISCAMSANQEYHFFRDAQPAIARFKPLTGVRKIRAFAHEVATRSGFPLRQGVLELTKHQVLLEKESVSELTELWRLGNDGTPTKELNTNDSKLVRQFLLLVIFPHLSSRKQLDILGQLGSSDSLLLRLRNSFKPLNKKILHNSLHAFFKAQNTPALGFLLSYINAEAVSLSKDGELLVEKLLSSSDPWLRSQSTEYVAKHQNVSLLKAFSLTAWKAERDSSKHYFDNWNGSKALLRSYLARLITIEEFFVRASPDHYLSLISYLRDSCVENTQEYQEVKVQLWFYILDSIEALSSISWHNEVPFEIALESNRQDSSGRYQLIESPHDKADMKLAFQRLSESNDEEKMRRQRWQEKFNKLRSQLNEHRAGVVL